MTTWESIRGYFYAPPALPPKLIDWRIKISGLRSEIAEAWEACYLNGFKDGAYAASIIFIVLVGFTLLNRYSRGSSDAPAPR